MNLSVIRPAVARAALGAGLVLPLVSTAVAQVPPRDAASAQKLEAVVVTGSYLPETAQVRAAPVVTLERAAIEQSGASDVLQLLKQLTPVFNGSANAGSEVNLTGFGESYVALRNLPTLVLLNGRRSGNSPFSSNVSGSTVPAVDLNTIPVAMIERIEILKDSASTLYGSDAVGGVVNVILRKNFEGAEVGARFGADGKGDYETKQAWVLGGVARGGLSVIAGAQYFENTQLRSTDRHISMLEPAELVALGQNPGVLAAHVSSSYAGRNGNFIIAGSPLAVGATGYNANIRSLPAKTNPNAAPQTIEQLVAAGYYLPINTTPLSRAAGGSATILNTAQYGFATVLPTERRQGFLSVNQELFGKKLELFGDYLFSRTLNGGSSLAPSPLAQVSPLRIPANNPYNLFGVAIGAGGAPNAPGLRTRFDELGMRWSDNEVELHRVVVGARGQINADWKWEVGYHFVDADGEQRFYGGADGRALMQALVPQLNASGGYVYDSTGRPLSVLVHNGRNVPVYDFFGIAGVNAPETLDALRTTLFREATMKQHGVDARATGKLFELPGGDVSGAVGIEWRREEIGSSADSLFNAGLAVGYIPLNNLPKGERSTRAAFVETRLPLLGAKNGVAGARQLDVSAAVRHERLSPGGNATLPKFGLRWQPFDEQLVARATYGRGFVAPSIFALYGPAQGSIPTVTVLEGNGQTGAGGATGRVVSGQFIAQTIELSNPTLTPAKSKSHTVGLVYSPKQVKGLSVSVDYYRIEQNKVGAFDYSLILADLNARGAASIYAPNFRFVDGSALTSNTPNQVTSTNAGSLRLVYDPTGALKTDGLDIATSYTFATRELGTFTAGADANVLFNFEARANATSPYLQYARAFTETLNGKGNPQGVQPGYTLRAHVGHSWQRWRTTARFSYVPAVNAPGTSFGERAGTPNVLRANLQPYTIDSYRTVDLAATYELPDFGKRWARRFSITAGVNNVFDEDPPFVPGAGSGVGSESNTVKQSYDIIGRYFFVELKKRF